MSQSVSIFHASAPILETNLQNLALLARGKVRDIYAIDDQHMLIVATDRLSAFDVVLPTGIADKGKILTQVALFWFEQLKDVVPNHLSELTLDDLPLSAEEKQMLEGRSMLVKRLKTLPVEAIVRGYLIGSGWKDYQQTGTVCGLALPQGLQMAQQLPEPIFTPSTKADVGLHDINISYPQVEEKIGKDLAAQMRKVSIELYQRAAAYALEHKIIIADTKFEFGLDAQGQLVLIDEILTPDSSRFWAADEYQIGKNPPSFDKQIVRDYLETLDWDKTYPGPSLPSSIVEKTAEKYREVATLLTQSN
ncbi:MAG: phosphoribosylaminoimidazolesuccinocarboxamide synthase [Thiothrix sp.]|nr:MAG: phosphoribosylaminoimidazolesuccinocarboxamide synthase [Thiothrix sp.]